MPLTLEDREEIRGVIARYDFAIDLGDPEAYANCFTEDGVFLHTGAGEKSGMAGKYTGRKELHDFCKSVYEFAEGQLRHWNNGVQILEGDGETAEMRSFIIGFTVGVYPVPKIFETGIYYDKFRKVNGKWYIAFRNFRCDPQPEHRGSVWDPQKFADDIR
jgi:SnoaL-like protein